MNRATSCDYSCSTSARSPFSAFSASHAILLPASRSSRSASIGSAKFAFAEDVPRALSYRSSSGSASPPASTSTERHSVGHAHKTEYFSYSETFHFIKCRGNLDAEFNKRDQVIEKKLWKHIESLMMAGDEEGNKFPQRTCEAYKTKWKNLKNEYNKKKLDSMENESAKSWIWYKLMDTYLGEHVKRHSHLGSNRHSVLTPPVSPSRIDNALTDPPKAGSAHFSVPTAVDAESQQPQQLRLVHAKPLFKNSIEDIILAANSDRSFSLGSKSSSGSGSSSDEFSSYDAPASALSLMELCHSHPSNADNEAKPDVFATLVQMATMDKAAMALPSDQQIGPAHLPNAKYLAIQEELNRIKQSIFTLGSVLSEYQHANLLMNHLYWALNNEHSLLKILNETIQSLYLNEPQTAVAAGTGFGAKEATEALLIDTINGFTAAHFVLCGSISSYLDAHIKK